MGPFLLLAVTFLLMWVLFILPQQRRMKAHQALVATLEEGDEVMLTSGVYGTIARLADDVVHLELAPGVVIRVARGAVARRVGDEPPPASEPGRPSGTAADRALEMPDPTQPEDG